MRYRRNNLSDQLKRVLEKVSANVREQHQRGASIGRLGRKDKERLLRPSPIIPLPPQTVEVDQSDDDE